ncbi:MAG: DUF2190 family protein [Verrucomicrobia bacterium]|nr:DUF2190 family protein [Verrucomicrobiota bacterium]
MKKLRFTALALVAAALLALSLFLAPRELLNVLVPVALLGSVLFVVANTSRLSRRSGLIAGTNTLPDSQGTHQGGRVTRLADAAITTRNAVVKIGSDAAHIAVAGTGDIAIGVCQDEPSAAEDPVSVVHFGSADRTLLVVASAAISAGDMIVTAASGKVRALPGTTGTYYIIGRALTAATADGDTIELDPCFPVQRAVA